MTMKVEIYGWSDDLIEVEGAIREEFDGMDDEHFIAFSDGTVLAIEYTNAGIWRINRVEAGTATYSKVEGTDAEDNYSDRVTLEGDLRWAVCGAEMAGKAK